jgi:uncharacterized membrane protein YgdD (TMEM256/DUF423 family)
MNWTIWIGSGAAMAGLAVGFGAFGAHYLMQRLEPNELNIFEIGARYQMYHALALLAVGFFAIRVTTPLLNLAGFMFLGGTVVFSGSLYLLALTGTKWLGAITPIGGVLLLLGWGLFAFSAFTLG